MLVNDPSIPLLYMGANRSVGPVDMVPLGHGRII